MDNYAAVDLADVTNSKLENSILLLPKEKEVCLELNHHSEISYIKRLIKFRAQIGIALTASLLAVSGGMHMGWVGPTILKLSSNQSEIPLTTAEISWLTMMLPLGASFGPTLGAVLATYFGRKNAILLGTIPSMMAWIIIFFASTVYELLTAQFISGLTVGIAFVVLTMYFGEISSPEIRGLISSLTITQFYTAIVIESAIVPFVSLKVNAIVSMAIPIILILLFIWMPESPYYCVIKNQLDSAKKSLKILNQTENEYKDLKDFVNEDQAEATTFMDIFRLKNNQFAIGLALAIMTMQEFSAVNITVAYGQKILDLKHSPVNVYVGGIILNGAALFASILGCVIVDQWGRRPLFMLSAFSTTIPLLLLGTYFHLDYLNYEYLEKFSSLPIIALVLLKVTYAIGMGPLAFVYLGETLSTNVKGIASLIACTYGSIFHFILNKLFQDLCDIFGIHITFNFFALCCLISGTYVYFVFPETKGKTLHEIQSQLKGRTKLLQKVDGNVEL